MGMATATGLSFDAYRTWVADQEQRFELVNGQLKSMNPPRTQHFFIAKALERSLEQEIERLKLPWICLQGAGVRTGPAKARLPDLMVIEQDVAIAQWEESAIFETIPRLVVEIVSPSSQVDDYRHKRMEYGAIEVPEYWIIDAIAQKITLLQLVEGLYEEAVFERGETVRSPLLPDWNITVDEVLIPLG